MKAEEIATDLEWMAKQGIIFVDVKRQTMLEAAALIRKQAEALEGITKVAGNRPDEALMTKTGGNDAVSRGIMVVSAREIALAALTHKDD